MKIRERITFSSLFCLSVIEAVAGADVSNSFGKHIHHTCIVGLVTKGVRIITHEGGESKILEGELFFLNPGQVHACAQGEEGMHSYLLFSMVPDVLIRISSQISEKAETGAWFGGVHGKHPGISEGIHAFFELLFDPLSTDFHKESHLYSLLAEVLLAFAQDPPEVCGVGRQEAAMVRVQKHIQAHYA